MALMNRHLTGLETVFLPGGPALEHVSSSLVKEVAAHGGDVSGLVPDAVLPPPARGSAVSNAERPVWAQATPPAVISPLASSRVRDGADRTASRIEES